MKTCLQKKKNQLKAQNEELAVDRYMHPRMTGMHKDCRNEFGTGKAFCGVFCLTRQIKGREENCHDCLKSLSAKDAENSNNKGITHTHTVVSKKTLKYRASSSKMCSIVRKRVGLRDQNITHT